MAEQVDLAAAKRAAADLQPGDFVQEYLLGRYPFIFSSSGDSFATFRYEIARALQVHASDLGLVGSAQLGFSLNPDHLLRDFRGESDLDVVVVSSVLFDIAWQDLLAHSSSVSGLEEDERRLFRKTQENFFHGYLRPDRIPTKAQLSKDWFPKLAGPFRSPIAKRHPVKAWLFKSWWHVEAFYKEGLSRIQPTLKRMLPSGGGPSDH